MDNSKNNFERGSTDNFVLQCANLGKLQYNIPLLILLNLYCKLTESSGKLNKIKIWHDSSGLSSAWLLSYVVVTSEAISTPFYFYSNSWYDSFLNFTKFIF